MLPGFFPWYPMAGEKQIFLENSKITSAYGYNPYNRIPKAHIRLQTDGKFSCVTNLNVKTGNLYEGDSDSITLFGGQLVITEDSVFQNYLPLDMGISKNEEERLAELHKQLEAALSCLEEEYGFDTTELRDKKVICPSKDVGRNFANNKFCVFDDYLITAEGYVDAGDVLRYYILKENKQTPLVRAFYGNGIWDEAQTGVANMENALETEAQMTEDKDRREENERLLANIRECCEKIGDKNFMRAAAQYAATDNDIYSDEEFFMQWGINK